MTNLDNRSSIEQLDSQNMLGSIERLADQVREVYQQAETITVPKEYQQCNNIVVLGMGGSTIGSHIIKSVFSQELTIPLEIVNHYHVPAFVSKNSLVVVSSYSGGTEEPLTAMLEAKKRGAKLMIITSGGELAARAKKSKLPALIFTTENNPCGSPRMGLGYSIIGQMVLFDKAKLIDLTAAKVQLIAKTIEKYNAHFGVDNPTSKNPAKQLATEMLERSIWYVGAEHLAGNVHAAANQLNENAKHFGGYFLIPELNHHLMEGVAHPASNHEVLAFLLVESKLYDPKIQKRFDVTKEILKKNKIFHLAYQCQEKTALLQSIESLVLGSYVSFYLAMRQGIDPTAIPFVDYFKAALKK